MLKLMLIPILFGALVSLNANADYCIKRYEMETVSLCLNDVERENGEFEYELSFDVQYKIPFENLWFVGVSSTFDFDGKKKDIFSKLFVQSEPSERELDARVWYYPDGRTSNKARILVNYSKPDNVRDYDFEEEMLIDLSEIVGKARR